MTSSTQTTSTRGANSSRGATARTGGRATTSGTLRIGPTARPGWLRAMLDHPLADSYLVGSAVALLVGIGLLMSLSASSVNAQANGDSPYYFAMRQVMFLALGVPTAWVLSRLPMRWLKPLGWAALVLALVLLVLTFTGLGYEVNGNRNWLYLGPIGLQPSEFAKAALVLWAAAVLATKERVLDQPRHLLFPLLFGALLICGLVLLQRDLGTGLVVVGIVFAILWLVGTPWKVLGGLTAVGVAVVGMLVLSSQNRMTRIMMFLHPPDATDTSVSQQPLSAIYALASGGWFGQGLGASKQKWGGLYDGAQNDYVFAVLGEELGLLGTVGVIALFSLLGWAGFRIARRSDTLFTRVLAGGLTSWLLMQAMVNMAVAMRLLPVIGVPLPFISVGGSALLANLIAAGLLLACARQEPSARRLRQARVANRPRVTTVVSRGRSSAGK